MKKILILVFILYGLYSCNKSSTPNAGNFSYTLIDTNGVSHHFSDFSDLIGGRYYYDALPNYASSYPSGYVANQSGGYFFLFYDYTTTATNNITFGVPNLNNTAVAGTDSSGVPSLVINYTDANGLNIIKPVAYTITTNVQGPVTTTTGTIVSGTFSLSGTTASGKTISATGAFSNFIIF